MSEYWISKKKYYCTYCEIYIADDAPSRTQHETGMRHTGNKDRYVRSLYKNAEKKVKDDAHERREMANIDAAAQAAFSVDVGAGRATGSAGARASAPAPAPAARALPPPPKPHSKPSNPYFNYTSAADLGIVDEDTLALEAQTALRRAEGRVGDWTVVEPTAPAPAVPLALGGISGPVDEDDLRNFQLKRRKIDVGLGQMYDPGVITLKPKVQPVEELAVAQVEERAADAPKWAPVAWMTSDASVDPPPEAREPKHVADAPKSEQADALPDPAAEDAPLPEEPQVKDEPAAIVIPAGPGPTFRKRKGMSSDTKRQR